MRVASTWSSSRRTPAAEIQGRPASGSAPVAACSASRCCRFLLCLRRGALRGLEALSLLEVAAEKVREANEAIARMVRS